MAKHQEIKENRSTPIWLEEGDKVTVFENVTVDTTNGSLIGISGAAGTNEVIVHGHVIGKNFGLGLRVHTPDGEGHDKVWVSSTGSIKGDYAIELADDSTVTIDGIVTGLDDGIRSYGAMTLTNSGTIKAEGLPLRSIAVSSTKKLDLTNKSGATIKGMKYGIFASSEDDVVRNSGHIEVSGHSTIDAIYLGDGDDVYDGRNGTVVGSIDLAEGDDTATGGAGQERIYGDDGDDLIEGGGGNDIIDGGDDEDKVIFTGKRSDYSVVKKADGSFVVSDKRKIGDGIDTVTDVEAFKFSDVTVKASDLLSTNPIETGNSGGSDTSSSGLTLYGTRKKDALVGGAGNDKLYGLSGNDVLTGGAGQDVFVFNTALGKGTTKKNHNKKVNYDTITDFNPTDDAIWLDNKIFKKLGKAGSEAAPASLNKKFFKVGKAKDKNDYLTYKNGVMFYDADGVGKKHKAVQVMKFADKPVLTAEDFFVI